MQVSTLKSAIAYISCLQQLIEDCDAGLVDETLFSFKEKENREKENKVTNKKSSKTRRGKAEKTKHLANKVKKSKPVFLDSKWKNYSEQFLGQRFSTPKDIHLVQSECAREKVNTYLTDLSQHVSVPILGGKTNHIYQDYGEINLSHPLPNIKTFNEKNVYENIPSSSSPTPSCSSPRDINEISLHISLIDNCATSPEEGYSYNVINGQEDMSYYVISGEEDKFYNVSRGQTLIQGQHVTS